MQTRDELFEALSGILWATGINNLTDAQMMREYGGVGLIARRKAQAALDHASTASVVVRGPTRDPEEASDGFTDPRDEEAAVQDECDRARI